VRKRLERVSMKLKWFLSSCLLTLTSLALGQSSAAKMPFALDGSKLIDLTHSFDQSTIYWPNAEAFHWEKERWGKTQAGTWYAAGRYAASEHGGTHIDSPIHFAEGKATVDEIPLSSLVGPAAVVDVTKQCEHDPDYQISAADIQRWERVHGRIPKGAIVLFRTGWGKFWPDKKRYMGSDIPHDITHLHFPGLSREAALYLTKNSAIGGIGIDTASLDPGTSRDFIAHQIINGANLYGLENLSSLERLPEQGAWILALPMKITGGSGGPTRVIAVLP
jgi:kynurenine formamidase